jgi:hypothetical protein
MMIGTEATPRSPDVEQDSHMNRAHDAGLFGEGSDDAGLECSIAVGIRRHGFASDKKATNWPGCLQLKNNGDKPDAVAWAGWGRLDENEI